MILNFKKIGFLLLFSTLLINLSSFAQTISLDDFAKEIKKDNVNKLAKKAEKKVVLKLLRDNQSGLSIQLFASISGNNKMSFEQSFFDTISNYKSSFLKGYDIRLSYTKESFIPFGLYVAFGNANLFLGGGVAETEIVDSTNFYSNTVINYTPNTDNYILFGLSKNISLNSTIYLGYMQFLTKAIRTEFLQTTSFKEVAGINFGFSYKLNRIIISLDNIIHLPFYKESNFYYNSYNELTEQGLPEPKTFGNRFQIGLGYLF